MKDQMLNLSKEVAEIEIRIEQLKGIKYGAASQKLELRVLENLLETKKKKLATMMFNHSNIDDLLTMNGLPIE